MREHNQPSRRHSERGEGNAKFIVSISVFILIGYGLYVFMPIYWKAQQLHHEIKDKTRIGAINNYDLKRVEKDCKYIIDDLDFPSEFTLKVTRKGDNLFVSCASVVPIKFPLYTYKYKINIDETFNRSGY
jgi:hypothetical protein